MRGCFFRIIITPQIRMGCRKTSRTQVLETVASQGDSYAATLESEKRSDLPYMNSSKRLTSPTLP